MTTVCGGTLLMDEGTEARMAQQLAEGPTAGQCRIWGLNPEL